MSLCARAFDDKLIACLLRVRRLAELCSTMCCRPRELVVRHLDERRLRGHACNRCLGTLEIVASLHRRSTEPCCAGVRPKSQKTSSASGALARNDCKRIKLCGSMFASLPAKNVSGRKAKGS